MADARLEELLHYQLLQRGLQTTAAVDTSLLEREFLDCSTCLPAETLLVKIPKLYAIEDSQRRSAQAALQLQGISQVPEKVDISGGFSYSEGLDQLLFFSLQQMEADALGVRSHLIPLVEAIYTSAGSILRDFTIHEVVAATVQSRRGNLNLSDLPLFPERFASGRYSLAVTLDSPTGTISSFRQLLEKVQQQAKQPQAVMLNPTILKQTTQEALTLRKKLGSLSRYETPENQTIEIETDSCVLRTATSTQFYLYTPKGQNVMVYFGENPLHDAQYSQKLTVIAGKNHQHVLSALIELGLFQPSEAVLEQRLKDVEKAYIAASRRESGAAVQELYAGLRKVQGYFSEVVNPDMRRQYVTRQPVEFIEFMVCPSSEDPVVHELLPRLSWNKAVRRYHNTGKFIGQFTAADEQARKKFLQEIYTNVLFRHQQNNDVNVWLYQQHQGFCEDQGIKFQVV